MRTVTLLGHVRNYLGASLAGKLTIIASIFIYSRLMSVDDYGVLSLYAASIGIAVILTSANLHTSIGRYIYEEKPDFPQFLSTVMVVMFLTFLMTVVLSQVFMAEASGILGLPPEVVTILLAVALSSSLESVLVQIFAYEERSAAVLRLTSSRVTASFLAGIAFLSVMNENKYYAIIYGELLVSILFIAYFVIRIAPYCKFEFKLLHLRYMLNYSLPLIPYMLSLTLLAQSDRIMINHYYSTYEAGQYSLIYNVASMVTLVLISLTNAWNPTFFKSMNNQNYEKVLGGSRSIFDIAVFITFFMLLFGDWIVVLILPPAYHQSVDVLGPVLLGGLSLSVWNIWARVMAYYKKTYVLSLVSAFAIIINIFLNIWLLPLLGYEIAAWTTFISYSVMALACMWMNSVLLPSSRYEVCHVVKWVAIMLLVFISIYTVQDYFFSMLVRCLFLIVALVFCKQRVAIIFHELTAKDDDD